MQELIDRGVYELDSVPLNAVAVLIMALDLRDARAEIARLREELSRERGVEHPWA